jgi:hypothetical protein
LNRENQLLDDIIKFWLAIDGDTCQNGFYHADYLKEKFKRIIQGNMIWHLRINENYEQKKALEYIQKR